MRTDGRGRRVLNGRDDFAPAWSPDGQRIVFSRASPGIKHARMPKRLEETVQEDLRLPLLVAMNIRLPPSDEHGEPLS